MNKQAREMLRRLERACRDGIIPHAIESEERSANAVARRVIREIAAIRQEDRQNKLVRCNSWKTCTYTGHCVDRLPHTRDHVCKRKVCDYCWNGVRRKCVPVKEVRCAGSA